MRDFEGKVAVVTGAASGMGRAFAERFAQEGMKVVLADVERDALDAAVLELQRGEHQVIGVLTDVSKADSVDELARAAIDAYGKVHLLCNNAGVAGENALIWEETPRDWEWLMGVNLYGVVNGLRTFVPLMLSHGEEGHIVNTASIAGLGNGWGIYGVTKHAVIALTESLSSGLRLIDAPIKASVLCPGGVNTRIVDGVRNRPPALTDNVATPPSLAADGLRRYNDRMRAAVGIGKEPSEIAEILIEGIRREEFYILTHPEEEEERVRQRAEQIISRQPPIPSRFLSSDA